MNARAAIPEGSTNDGAEASFFCPEQELSGENPGEFSPEGAKTQVNPAASPAGAVATLTATVTPRRGRKPVAPGLYNHSQDWRAETRVCPHCGETMRPKANQRRSEWRRLLVCSRRCAAQRSHDLGFRKSPDPPTRKAALCLDRRARILEEWPAWARFEDDPRARSDAFPAKVVPAAEWSREV